MGQNGWNTVAASLVVAATLCASPARAQEWPSRPIRVILPFPAGGSTDALLRMVGDKLQQRLGQPFVVENKPGGATLIGTSEVVRAVPDGHTLLLNSNGITLLHMTVKTDFDVRRDLLPVTMLRGGMSGAWINASVPASNIKEFIAYVKANRGKVNYASLGPGTPQHIEYELLKQAIGDEGFDLVGIPYKGEAPSIQALLTGEVQLFMAAFLQLGPQAAAGKVKLIAAGGAKRAPQFPNVPTYREQGLDYTHTYWSGFFAPAKMPMETARKLQRELGAVYRLPDVYPVLTRNGEDVGGEPPEEFRKEILDRIAKMEAVVKRIGLQPQ